MSIRYMNIKLFKNGKLDEIISQHKLGFLIPHNALLTCIKNDDLDLYKFLYSLGTIIKHDSIFCSIYNSLKIMKHLVSIGLDNYEYLLKTAIINNSKDIVLYLFETGYQFSHDVLMDNISFVNFEIFKIIMKFIKAEESDIHIAIWYGRLNIVLYLLELGYKLTSAPRLSCYTHNYRKILTLYHDLELPGEYRKSCIYGVCNICHTYKIKKIWELDSNDDGYCDYDNYIQFLPRELVDDLGELVDIAIEQEMSRYFEDDS